MKTIAITSGKGGVGKTSITANLAIALAQRSENVVVFDADFGLANLDIMFGVKAPRTLLDVLTEEANIMDILCKGPSNLRFVAGGSGVKELLNLSNEQLDRFFSEFAKLEGTTDYLLIDTAAGLSESVVRIVESADEVLLICTPDPTSIMDTYATIKTVLNRNGDAVISLLVNQVSGNTEAREIHEKLNKIVHQFLTKSIGYAGYIRTDQQVIESVRKREPFMLASDVSSAVHDIDRLASWITDTPIRFQEAEKKPEEKMGFFQKLKSKFSREKEDQNARRAA